MPAFFISLGIGFLVFFYLIAKKKDLSFATPRALIAAFGLAAISFIVAGIAVPKEYVLVKEQEIVPIELEGQEYFVISRAIADPVFFTKDKNEKIKRNYRIAERKLNIIEEERNNGIFRVYENRSKTYKFFCFMKGRKYEILIPKNTIFENQ